MPNVVTTQMMIATTMIPETRLATFVVGYLGPPTNYYGHATIAGYC